MNGNNFQRQREIAARALEFFPDAQKARDYFDSLTDSEIDVTWGKALSRPTWMLRAWYRKKDRPFPGGGK
ncbi:MAG TPA: hypothetical protein DCZ03_02290 [Gammaproteobacteria bacterium]|nr:hypothetical protein [Gammaproteobacteria bacterium]